MAAAAEFTCACSANIGRALRQCLSCTPTTPVTPTTLSPQFIVDGKSLIAIVLTRADRSRLEYNSVCTSLTDDTDPFTNIVLPLAIPAIPAIPIIPTSTSIAYSTLPTLIYPVTYPVTRYSPAQLATINGAPSLRVYPSQSISAAEGATSTGKRSVQSGVGWVVGIAFVVLLL
jgi:hypothetical protein